MKYFVSVNISVELEAEDALDAMNKTMAATKPASTEQLKVVSLGCHASHPIPIPGMGQSQGPSVSGPGL